MLSKSRFRGSACLDVVLVLAVVAVMAAALLTLAAQGCAAYQYLIRQTVGGPYL